MTDFEMAQQQIETGKITAPNVSYGGRDINYLDYQLSVHYFNLKIMAAGMKCRGINLTSIKRYYGLKGRTAKDCLPQFEKVMADFKKGKVEVTNNGVVNNLN